jgi:hypothetical protein
VETDEEQTARIGRLYTTHGEGKGAEASSAVGTALVMHHA